MITIYAKYRSRCSRCKKIIKKNEIIDWDKYKQCVYHKKCGDEIRMEMEHEQRNTQAYVQAQEDAYFERFTKNDTYYEKPDNDYEH